MVFRKTGQRERKPETELRQQSPKVPTPMQTQQPNAQQANPQRGTRSEQKSGKEEKK